MNSSLRQSRLSRKPAQRGMLLRNLATSLILYESIRTTKARARVLQPLIERLIVRAKTRSPHTAVRYVNRVLTDRNAAKKMFEVIVPLCNNRPSGFTRTIPLGRRRGDGAEMVEITLTDRSTPSSSSSMHKDHDINQSENSIDPSQKTP